MYCVKCGAEGELYEHLCKNCFLEKTTFFKIPEVIKTTHCPHCLARAWKNHWEDSDSEDSAIQAAVVDNIKIQKKIGKEDFTQIIEPTRTNVFNVTIQATGEFENLEISEELSAEVRINYNSCPQCSRVSGSYYEAILQVRATNRSMNNDELDHTEELVINHFKSVEHTEPNAFITRSEYIHGGIDFYVGSSNIARQIAKLLSDHFKGKLNESSSLIGRHDGRDSYRNTFIIRIPEFRVGDFVKCDNQIFIVKKIHKRTVECINLPSGQKSKFEHSSFSSCSILGGSELIFDAVVILESGKEVQILDPDNYQTVELLKPQNFEVSGETVRIIKYQDQIYLVP